MTTGIITTSSAAPPFAASFHLNDAVQPTQPLVGHGSGGDPWITGSITVRWPGDSAFHNATTDHIVEVGFGDYELLADPSEVAVSGCAYLYAAVAGQQPWRYFYHVATPGDIVIREVPFLLVSTTDINGDTTGHTFTLGDVQLRFANGSYTDVPLTQIKERGNNMYAVVLTDDQRTNNIGLVYVYCAATATTMQFTESFDMIVGGGGPIGEPTLANPVPAPGILNLVRATAKWTPVQFDIVNFYATRFSIWMLFTNSNAGAMVYDSVVGFLPPFDHPNSTWDGTTMRVQQQGGWQDNPLMVTLGGQGNPDIVPVRWGGPGSIKPPHAP